MTHGVLAPQRSTFVSRKTVNGSRGQTTPWVRPADWLSVPVPAASDQRFVGLHCVFNNGSNFVTVRSGVAFKVDWGDGAGWVNYAANTTAEKNLAWGDYSSATLTTGGFRQALITVEAQSGNLTSVNLQQRHSWMTFSYATGWLDVAVSLPNGSVALGGNNVYHTNLKRANVVALSTADFSYMFAYCYMLREVLFTANAATGVTFASMFASCYSLQSVPLFNTAAGTTFANMFQYCYSLQSVPLLNTTSGTNFTNMFFGCYSLQSVPLLNTTSGTNFTNMFLNCYFLQAAALSGTRYAINYANCLLSAAALNDIYTNLGTPAGGAQTITVTGNWGTATDNPSLVPSGWTVAGS